MIKLNAHYLIRASAVLKIIPLIFICLKELKDIKLIFFYNKNVLLSLDFLPFFSLFIWFFWGDVVVETRLFQKFCMGKFYDYRNI